MREKYVWRTYLIVTVTIFHCSVQQNQDWHFAGPNIALGKNATQSTDYEGHTANLAVDGMNTSVNNLEHCSHTDLAVSPNVAWWKVELQDYFYVTGVRIYNRDAHARERLRNFIIMGHTKDRDVRIYRSSNDDYKKTVIDVHVNGTTSYNSISISLPPRQKDSYLTLCEVEIHALGCPTIHQDWSFLASLVQGSGLVYYVGVNSFNPVYTLIKIQCYQGHAYPTAFTIYCQPNREYNTSSPFCNSKPSHCTQPILMDGYYMPYENTYVPFTRIHAYCNDGYILKGSNFRVCQVNGSWSGSNTCLAVYCKIPTISHGHFPGIGNIQTKIELQYGSSLMIVCNTGYEAVVKSITCQSNGQWNRSLFFCNIKNCTAPNNLTNGHYEYNNGAFPLNLKGQFNYNTVLNVVCNDGYTLNQQTNVIVCTSEGHWDAMPKCSKRLCEIPLLLNGFYTFHGKNSTSIHFGDAVIPQCSQDLFKLDRNRNYQRICTANGTLSGSDPVCVPLCKIPSLQNGVYVNINGTVSKALQQGEHIMPRCEKGFERIDGKQLLTCQSNHSWDFLSACKVKTCRLDQIDLQGNNVNVFPSDSQILYNHTVQLQCKEGHEMIGGLSKILCNENKVFVGDPLRCKAKTCDLEQLQFRDNNIRLDLNESLALFNQTVLLKCNDGYENISGYHEIRCGDRNAFIGEPLLCQEIQSSSSASQSSTVPIGGIGGGCAAVIVVVVVGGVLLYRRRKPRSKSRPNSKQKKFELSDIQTEASIDKEIGNEYSTINETEESDQNFAINYVNMAGSADISMNQANGSDHVYNEPQPEIGDGSYEYYSFSVEKLPESAIRIKDVPKMVVYGTDDDKLKLQFEAFPKGMIAQHTAAMKLENRGKNKYKEMYAYDMTRVVLQPGSLKSETDYINASYINGFSEPRWYIAAQAPFDPTLNDFWRMIWQNGVSKIVMLTRLKEEGKIKCDQYWPKKDSAMYGRIRVTMKKFEEYSDFTIRQFAISKDDTAPRTVLQFHYTAWPDKGVPKFASSLVHFRQKAMTTKTDTKGPVVIHCSAGIGRTGTFIALDILTEQGKRLGYVDVMGCVQTLRKQRVMMVQTLEQYIFIHLTLTEALMLSPSVLPAADFTQTYENALKVDAKTGTSQLYSEYEMLQQLSPTADDGQYISAKEIRNRKKNRYPDILPVDDFMPRLKDGSDGDYINAVFLPSYKMKDAFIITQSPLESTQEEFWRLVYEHKVHTIVMMNNISELQTEEEIYWPQGEDPITFDNLQVTLIDMEEEEGHNIMTLQLSSSNKNRKIKLMQYCHQLDGQFPGSPESILTLMELVLYWQQQTGNNPVVVHCMNGVDKSGLYCVISAVIDRLKIEQDVGISQTIEVMRNRREQLIISVEQFKFCHDVVLAYLNQFDTYSNFTEAHV